MAFVKFAWKSFPYLAELGQGDGTAYATFDSATVSASAKTFTLTNLQTIADLTQGDDYINGYLYKVTSSGNVYHVTDFNDTGDVVTVAETPDTADIGAGEILVNVLDAVQTAAFPARFGVDWRPFTLWKGTSATQSDIYFFAPNFIKDGGFEEQAAGNVGGDWTAESIDWQVSATTPIRGSRMAVWDTTADAELTANFTAKVLKGRTYTVLFNAQAVTNNPDAGVLDVKIRQKNSPNTDVDSDFGTAGTWNPVITTTATWFTQDFTPDFDTDEAQFYVDAINANIGAPAATAIRIDEVYIFEKITPTRFLVSDHNWNGSENIVIEAAYLNPLRTNFAAGDHTTVLASFDQDGTAIIDKAMTSSSRPVYHLSIPAETAKTHEAGIIFMGEVLTFNKSLTSGSAPVGKQKTQMAQNVSRLGNFIAANVEFIQRDAKLTFDSVQRTWLEDNFLPFWEQHGRNMTPFFLLWDDANYADDIFLMRIDKGLDFDLGKGPFNIDDFKVSLKGVV